MGVQGLKQFVESPRGVTDGEQSCQGGSEVLDCRLQIRVAVPALESILAKRTERQSLFNLESQSAQRRNHGFFLLRKHGS